MIKIFNSLKIILAAVLAILLARFLNLDFAISAGIVAILSVQPTKKETLETALSRFLAFIFALVIAFFSYRILGFNSYGFFLYLGIFIIVCQFFHWYSAMAMDSVLISHFITLQGFGFKEITNEGLLFVIGVGFGILLNLFLHKKVDKIEQLKKDADEQIRLILHRMSLKIMDLDFSDYNGDCFEKLDKSILEAKLFARENFKNQFKNSDVYDEKYIEMREEQKEVLKEIFKCIIELKTVPSTATQVSAFFEKVSIEYEKDNDVLELMKELASIQQSMKERPLPQNRKEFEDRAILFMILKRMEEFLKIKNKFYTEVVKNRK